ncbi:glycosyltransferase family 2 protein [Novosphingobium sp.]|uniref:glycosyltransferase family 2 protein n=1 Tax=Novosphingobium sp. TaxID=1874826 RepID=UPI003BAB6BDC
MSAQGNTPHVTVVMPVYNAAATISATIASVLAQTFTAFELVIVNDGSTDDTLTRLMPLAEVDPRIHLVSRPNGGVSSARNLGVELARGELIAFIDADDLWAADKLAAHVARHRSDAKLAASYARIGFLPQHAATLDACRTLSSVGRGPLRLIEVLGENPVCTMSNLVVRRDAFIAAGGLDTGLSHAEDQEFVARLLSRGSRIEAINAVLVGYRFSPDGLSMDFDRMKAGWQLLARRHLDGPALAALEALYLRYLARRTLRSGGSPVKALSYALAGLRTEPRAFLADRRRGLGTLAGSFAAPILPRAMRRHVFA